MTEEIRTKRCSKCGQVKSLSEFYNQKSQKEGKSPSCKQCAKEYQRKYQAGNQSRIRKQQAEYARNHPEAKKRYQRKYEETHAEEILQRRRTWGHNNQETNSRARMRRKSDNPAHVLFLQTRSRAKKSNILFTIEETDLFIPETCPVLGIPLRKPGGPRSNNTASVDRLVPSLGYTPRNISVISWRANRLKNDGTAEELHRIADWIDKQTSS